MRIASRSVRAPGTVVFAAALLLAATTRSAFAEPFIDLYIGGAETRGSDVKVETSGFTLTGPMDWGASFTAGGRAGYWFGTPGWLGVSLDVSYLKPASDTFVVPVSLLLMLRAPLMRSDAFPHGRLQPYIGAGPGAFISRVGGGLVPGGDGSAAGLVDVGADARAGIAYHITTHVVAFVEYRYTHVRVDFKFNEAGRSGTITTTFDTQSALGGLGYRF
jgi:opacity protein-like surface antigen